MVFLFVSILIFNLTAVCMRKNLAPIENYAIIFTGLFWSELADRFTDKWDWYGFFQPIHVEWQTLLILFGLYPAAAVMIVNWLPFGKSWLKRTLYILGWSVFSVWFEWLMLKFGLMYHHHGWNLWWSGLSYPILYTGLILHLKWIHKLYAAGKR